MRKRVVYIVKAEFINGWCTRPVYFNTYEEAKELFDQKVASNNYGLISLIQRTNGKVDKELDNYIN